jgi:hypothetical protein
MQDHENADPTGLKRVPWNKGKLIGAKPPLRPKHVWSIRTKLQVEGWTRDLAMFNLAIDSKLRGCDDVALKVDDIAPSGYAVNRATVRQKKTGQPVRFELTELTRARRPSPPDVGCPHPAHQSAIMGSGLECGETLNRRWRGHTSPEGNWSPSPWPISRPPPKRRRNPFRHFGASSADARNPPRETR